MGIKVNRPPRKRLPKLDSRALRSRPAEVLLAAEVLETRYAPSALQVSDLILADTATGLSATITLDRSDAATASVVYFTAPDTKQTQSVVFAAGQTSQTFTVNLAGDASNSFLISEQTNTDAPGDSLQFSIASDSRGVQITSNAPIDTISAPHFDGGSITAPAIGQIIATNGPLLTNIAVTGAIGSITVVNGSAGGHWSAASFGEINIAGGGFTGSITAVTTDAAHPAFIGNISILGGDLNGQITVHGFLGALEVNKDLLGHGGSVVGATITAQAIGKMFIAGDLLDSSIQVAGDIGSFSLLGKIQNSFISDQHGQITPRDEILGGQTYFAADSNLQPIAGGATNAPCDLLSLNLDLIQDPSWSLLRSEPFTLDLPYEMMVGVPATDSPPPSPPSEPLPLDVPYEPIVGLPMGDALPGALRTESHDQPPASGSALDVPYEPIIGNPIQEVSPSPEGVPSGKGSSSSDGGVAAASE